MNKKPFWTMKKVLIAAALLLLAAVIALFVYNEVAADPNMADDLTEAQAESFVNQTLQSLPLPSSDTSVYIAENTHLTVKSILSRDYKKAVLLCEYETLDIGHVYEESREEIWTEILKHKDKVSTMITIKLKSTMRAYLEKAPKKTGEVELALYQVGTDEWMLHLSDEAVNTCFGSLLDVRNDIKAKNQVGDMDITRYTNLRNAFLGLLELSNYDSEIPDTSKPLEKMWNGFTADFYKNFIKDARWEYLADGLLTTLEITGAALVLGVLIGFIVAVVRATYLKTKRLLPLDLICRLYLTVIRGTPLMVQLLIIYFVLLLPIGIPKFWAAVLCFGFNSGAYVAEIVRGGIMSIDEGQSEAGRSLGFNYVQTMLFIVIPQAFKNVLPALANEFIVLLKESSVAFYIGVADLTQGGLKIRSLTYSDFLPLLAVALIYLVVVVFLSYLVSLLERRLRKSDR